MYNVDTRSFICVFVCVIPRATTTKLGLLLPLQKEARLTRRRTDLSAKKPERTTHTHTDTCTHALVESASFAFVHTRHTHTHKHTRHAERPIWMWWLSNWVHISALRQMFGACVCYMCPPIHNDINKQTHSATSFSYIGGYFSASFLQARRVFMPSVHAHGE